MKNKEGRLPIKPLKFSTTTSVLFEKLPIIPLLKKLSAFHGIRNFISQFTTARLNPNVYPVFSRPVLILYSFLGLKIPRVHKYSIPQPKPISAQSFILHSCRSVLLSAGNWRSHNLDLCEFHQYNYICLYQRLQTTFPTLSANRMVTFRDG